MDFKSQGDLERVMRAHPNDRFHEKHPSCNLEKVMGRLPERKIVASKDRCGSVHFCDLTGFWILRARNELSDLEPTA